MASVTQKINSPLLRAGLTIGKEARTAIASLTIMSYYESVNPGQILFLFGGGIPSNATVHLAIGTSDISITLPIIKQEQRGVKVRIPANLPLDVYRVWVSNGTNISPPVYINQATGVSFGVPEVYSGARMLVIGNNLSPLNLTSKPTIKFVAQSNGAISYGTYISNGSHKNKLYFIAPIGLTVGAVYNVFITNGSGPESQVTKTLTAITPGVDVWNLGLSWGAKFAPFYKDVATKLWNVKTDTRLATKALGDGITNDRVAIMDAANAASGAGGGTVYLPDGRYIFNVTGDQFVGLDLPPNVVICGNGPGKTTFVYGSAGGKIVKSIYFDGSKTLAGIADMTIECADNTTGNFGAGAIQGKEFFFKNVKWNIKKGDWLEITNTASKWAVQDSLMEQLHPSGPQHGLLGASAQYGCIRNTQFIGVYGIEVGKCTDLIIEKNVRVLRDVALGRTGIPHSITSHYCYDSSFDDILIDSLNGPVETQQAVNADESFIWEDSSSFDIETGTATGSTNTTLINTGKSWATTFAGPNPCVAIIDGTGTGQLRRITARSATTLTVDKAWDINPDATSVYSISQFLAENVYYTNIRIKERGRGFLAHFATSRRVVMRNIELLNGGSVDFNPVQIYRTNSVQFTPLYDYCVDSVIVDVSNNTNGGFIGIHATQNRNNAASMQCLGTMAVGFQFVKCVLISKSPEIPARVDADFSNDFKAHMEIQVNYSAQTDKQAIVGVTFQDCVSRNTTNGVKISSLAHLTTIDRHTNINVNTPVLDETLPNQGTGSTNTTIFAS